MTKLSRRVRFPVVRLSRRPSSAPRQGLPGWVPGIKLSAGARVAGVKYSAFYVPTQAPLTPTFSSSSQLINRLLLIYGNKSIAARLQPTKKERKSAKMCYGATCPDCCKNQDSCFPLGQFAANSVQQRSRGSDAENTSRRPCRACPRRTGARVSPRWK